MHSRTQILTLIIVFCFLFFPICHDIRPFFKEHIPHGVPGAKQYFGITLDNYISGKWQKRVTERAKKNSGLWDPFLRISNEVMYNVFSQMGLFENASVFLGKDDYMIQTTHLKEFNRENSYSLDRVNQQLEKLKILQEAQRKKGKGVILVITPTVASLYPELLPENYVDPSRETRIYHYDLIKKKIDELGLIHVDAQEILYTQRNAFPTRLFAKTAAHWNDIGSCLALQAISNTLKKNQMPDLGDIQCDAYVMKEVPMPKDLDLLDLANVWFPESYYEPTPYILPQQPLSHLPDEKKPVVQLVGTSYLMAFYKHLKDWELTRGIVQYFYFRMFRTEENRKFNTLHKKNLKWKDILDRDIIIVNIGMSNLSGLGNGFVEESVKHLQ